MAESFPMDEICRKLGLTPDQLREVKNIWARSQGPMEGPIPGQQGRPWFIQAEDKTAPDVGGISTRWPLLPWDLRPADDTPPSQPQGFAAKGTSGQSFGVEGVTPVVAPSIGKVAGFNEVVSLSPGTWLSKHDALTDNEGAWLDWFLNPLTVA
jgi:hypothetical protein